MYAKMSTQSFSNLTASAQAKRQQALEIIQRMQAMGYNIKTNLNDVENVSSFVEYVCSPCNTEIRRKINDVFRNGRICRECTNLKLKMMPTDQDQHILNKTLGEIEQIQGEEWRPIVGGWVSSHARGINAHGKFLTPDERGRLYFASKLYYPNALIAEAFKDKVKISENVSKQQQNTDMNSINNKQIVISLQNKSNGVHVDNLIVQLRTESQVHANAKTHQSDRFKQAISMSIYDKIKNNVPAKQLAPELPDHIAFADGSIFNSKQCVGGNRFVSGSLHETGYLLLSTNDRTYKMHRLICWAFHPIEGKTSFDDYQDLIANHINGIKTDNRADNLEWATKNQNSQHAYDTKLNKKVRGVIQYSLNADGTQGNEIARFESVAKAARETKEPEHRIRETATGKKRNFTNFVWKFEDESITDEWSKKFSSKRKTPDV